MLFAKGKQRTRGFTSYLPKVASQSSKFYKFCEGCKKSLQDFNNLLKQHLLSLLQPCGQIGSLRFQSSSQGSVNPPRGFTLIELMVSVALFSIVMTISIGSLLTLVDANRKAQALKVINNNLSFAMDSMTRTIRTGEDYYCGDASTWSAGAVRDCATGGTDITVIDDGGVRKRYSYDSSAFAIMRYVGSSVTPERMTAPGVQIDAARFFVTGTTKGVDTVQPRVTILIQASAGSAQDIRTTFNLQTTVTQRVIDI